MPFSNISENPENVRPQVRSLDHLVLTVKDLNETVMFYSKVLGMNVTSYGNGRLALGFGNQKINLHSIGQEFSPHAHIPTPGSQDLCFVTLTKIPDWLKYLESQNIPIVEGPIERTGAVGLITSIYIRDPDQNLIEIGSYE